MKLRSNLHLYQKDFLEETAENSGMTINDVCALLIGSAAEGKNAETKLIDQLTPKPFDNSLAGSRRWTTLAVEVDTHSYKQLCRLANAANKSPSRTLRHLIENYINTALQDKTGFGLKWKLFQKNFPKVLRKYWAGFAFIFLSVIALSSLMIYSRMGLSVESPPWAGDRASIIFDPHTHTNFSGGALSLEDLVNLAVDNGCNAMAITDLSSRRVSATKYQLRELQRLRGEHPTLFLFGGIEVSVPRYRGRERLGVLVTPVRERAILRQLGDIAEHAIRETESRLPPDESLIRMLIKYHQNKEPIVTIYNHPSKNVPDVEQSIDDVLRWVHEGYTITAIEGGPGHQKDQITGGYKLPVLTTDRWDPIVADIGGGWDELLSQGFDIWGAIASSNYQNKEIDPPPCAFARTHVAVPEKSYSGVMSGIQSGTFWADHGRILDQFILSVEHDDLKSPAYPGSTVHVDGRKSVGVFNVAIERGPGSKAMPLTAELISNCVDGISKQVAELEIAPGSSKVSGLFPLNAVGLDERSCYIRARVRLDEPDQSDLMAYSNHIRFTL